jgi:CRISPR-associated exonuclease Cas4
MEYQEDDYLLLSGIQHFAFCRRQWALIHIEQQWQENLRTYEGKNMHEKAHNGNIRETRNDVFIVRAMKVASHELGISGECDIVEFHKTNCGISLQGHTGLYTVIPIEYKRGAPKEHDADELQLTAQAMCLEEMLFASIEKGYLYYGETHRRTEVVFSSELRDRVRTMLNEMHGYYERRYTPKVKMKKSCDNCSLCDICMPKLCDTMPADKYIENTLMEKIL